jgi:hypothetical protein
MRIVALPEKSGTSKTRPASAAPDGDADAAVEGGVVAAGVAGPQLATANTTAHATRTRT